MSRALTRHFFHSMLRPETASGDDTFLEWLAQVLGALIAAGWLFPSYFLSIRYGLLHAQPDPARFHAARQGDFVMALCVLALFIMVVTAVEWPMLFPSRKDHLVLSPLPIARHTLFGAKLTAVLWFVSLFILATAGVLAVTLTAIATGTHEPRLLLWRMAAHLVAAVAACYSVFFTLFAGQGLLAAALPARWFAPVSFAAQSTVLLAAICAFPLLIYVPARDLLTAPWFPPAWFLAMANALLGEPAPLAVRGAATLAAAIAVTLLSYYLAYRRFSQQALETPRRRQASARPWRNLQPFVWLTLRRGRDQKLVWLLIAAVGIALLLENSIYITRRIGRYGWETMAASARGSVVAGPLILCYCAMAGLRRALRVPADPPAGWVFRFHESPALRRPWLDTAWHTLAWRVGAGALALCLPAHCLLLPPWTALAVACWQLLLMLTLANYLLWGWNTVPFTSAYNPVRRHVLQSLMIHFASLVGFVTLGALMIELALADSWVAAGWTVPLLALLAAARHIRLSAWGQGPLEFAEPEAEAVSPLRLS